MSFCSDACGNDPFRCCEGAHLSWFWFSTKLERTIERGCGPVIVSGLSNGLYLYITLFYFYIQTAKVTSFVCFSLCFLVPLSRLNCSANLHEIVRRTSTLFQVREQLVPRAHKMKRKGEVKGERIVMELRLYGLSRDRICCKPSLECSYYTT